MQSLTLNAVLRGDTLFHVAIYADRNGELFVDFATCQESQVDCERATRTQYRRGAEYCGTLIVKVEVIKP
jgi:hypothetical protein